MKSRSETYAVLFLVIGKQYFKWDTSALVDYENHHIGQYEKRTFLNIRKGYSKIFKKKFVTNATLY